MRPGVEQIAVVSREADKGDLPVIREAFVEPEHGKAFHSSDHVLLQLTEKHRFCRGRRRRHVVIYKKRVAVESVRIARGETRLPKRPTVLVEYVLDRL